jgi:two-component system chemotaxis sensor kinase CheA
MSERFELQRFLQTFVIEARERLARVEHGVVRLERESGNQDLYNELLREAHTLKGSARMIGLMKVDGLAHRLEEVIGALRDAGEAPPRHAIDAMLEATDALKALVEEAAGGPAAPDIEDLGKRMARWAGSPAPAAPRGVFPTQAAVASHTAAESRAQRPAGPEHTVRVEVAKLEKLSNLSLDLLSTAEQAKRADQGLGRILQDVQRLRRAVTELAVRVESDQQLVSGGAGAAGRAGAPEMRSFGRPRFDEFRARPEPGEGASEVTPSAAPQSVGAIGNADSDRVAVEGRQSRLQASLARDLAAASAQHRAIVEELVAIRQALQTDSHRVMLIMDELRELAIDLHMLPVSTVFDAFPRAVRDLAAEYEKEIQFIVEGGEVKLDKKIIEEIGEPLLHLLRNAVAHGIEAPEQRERAGKPRRGMIRMSAATRANHILITVQDDGSGMDVEALRAKAVERGLVEAEAAERLTQQQALELAFAPGVSTTRMITDVSGRGMGMDVVRAVARRLNGTVSIASHSGTGCAVTLELPLTLAIMHVILVRAAGYDMAMPSSFVRAIHTAPEGGELPRTFAVDDKTLAVVSLADLMELAAANGRNGHRHRIVVIHAAGESLGVAAEEILDEREVILRPLGPHLVKQTKVMAAALLAEGQVVPVLDVPGLVEAAKSYQRGPAPARAEPKARPAILLVEDSVITADLERSILEQAGYEVAIAADGVEALAKLAERSFNLIVADIEMPRMDGFELLERVRGASQHAGLPVVIVTARQSLEDKRRGLALGANAYITKGTFDQNVLVDTVGRLIG